MWSARRPRSTLVSRYVRNIFPIRPENGLAAYSGRRLFAAHRIQSNSRQMKAMQNEMSAIVALLNRSFASNQLFARNIGTTARLYDEQKPKSGSNESTASDKNTSDHSSNQKKRVPDDDTDEDDSSPLLQTVLKFGAIMIGAWMILRLFTTSVANEISFQAFQVLLANGEIRELVLEPDAERVIVYTQPGAMVNGNRLNKLFFVMNVPDMDHFTERLRDYEEQLGVKESIPTRYSYTSPISRLVAIGIITLIFFFVAKNVKFNVGAMNMKDVFKQMSSTTITMIHPKSGGKGIYFKDVAGLQEAKQEVIEFVDYLKNPAKYKALGARVPKGALLLGPPGTGKTLLAKAVATEASVPFLTMNGSEFIEMIGGLGASRVRSLFKKAKKHAPCIVYIDEIDAIGRKRADSTFSSGESEQTLNQLLVEMDGMASKEGVLMLASTNRADILDKALLRPGRFDRHITVDLPTLIERKEIFEVHLATLKLDKPPNTYSQRLAILTPGFSGADIANVCNEAALHAARLSQDSIGASNLEYAIERVIGGTEKRSHAMSVEERKVVAYHESGHALVGWLLEHSDVLQKVTIVPRTNLALGFAQYTPHDQKLHSKEQLTDKICMALGGRAAENITFNRITTGAQNDLEKVTKIATAMVTKFGMNDEIGPLYVPDEQENNYFGIKPYSQALAKLIDLETRKLIAATNTRAEEIIRQNSGKLEALAEALLLKETLNYDQVVELIGPPKYDSAKRKMDPADFEHSLKDLTTSPDDSNDIGPTSGNSDENSGQSTAGDSSGSGSTKMFE